MSDFRYLDYEGLTTYTEHVKEYADGKIVYVSDESEIPPTPKEGTLYVIGSEILMDEEIIIGTQTSNTSNWTGKSIDTRLHDGKRIAYYLPYQSVAGTPISLTLELSDEDNTTQQKRIYVNGSPYNQVIPGGSVIRLMYYENIFANGARISGWISDGNIIRNNVTYTGNPVDEQVATFEGTAGTIKASGYTIASSVPANAKFDEYEVTVSHAGEAQTIPPRESPAFAIDVTLDSAPYKGMKLKINMNDTSSLGTRYVQVFIIMINGVSYNRINNNTPSTYSFVRSDATFEIEFVTDTQWEFTNSRINYPSNFVIANNNSMSTVPENLVFSFDTESMPIITNYMEFDVKFTKSIQLTNHQFNAMTTPINGSPVLVKNLSLNTDIDNTKVYRLKFDSNYILFCSDEDTLVTSVDTANYASYSNVVYATCSTTVATSSKVATIIGNTNFKLVTGAVAYVRFTYSNTSTTLSLNVGSTGAKYIRYRSAIYNGGAQIAQYPSWTAGDIVQFVYDGTYWNMVAPTITMKASSDS